jgi:aspartyl-tRNA(Asn)/glutamyl-tRNA(Gln) amidotransferase subunit B
MNSFKAVERALNYEIERQVVLIREGGAVIQQTLLWDDNLGESKAMRSKEEAHDYRYFPEPDLVRLRVDKEWIQSIADSLIELPHARQERFVSQYNIPKYDAEILTLTKMMADYYEETLKYCSDAKLTSNWIMSEMMAIMKERKQEADQFIVKPKQLGELLELVVKDVINGKIAKTVFEEMHQTGKNPQIIVEEKGLIQIADDQAIEQLVDRMFEQNQKQLNEYLSGKEAVFGHFVGQVMKLSNGKANPKLTNDILKEKLKKLKECK